MKLTRRFSVRALLISVTLFAVAFGICWNRHSLALDRYEVISRLRPQAPNPMIYFDQMIDWDENCGAYRIKDGDALALPPIGWQKTLCGYFDSDYVCPPRLVVFIDPPDRGMIEEIEKLPTVKQVVFAISTKSLLKTWRQELPDKKIQSWKEFRSTSDAEDAG